MRFATVLAAAAIFAIPAVAKAAPQQLYGKSIIITTSESRTSRPVGGGPTVDTQASNKLSVYVSEAGRAFVRSDRTLYRGRRGSESKAIDTGPGGGAIGVAVAGNVQFSGNTMTVNMQMASGARRITATFDSSFSGCTGSVINGREGGNAMVIKNRYSGENREVLAIQSSVTGCSVQSGNVFGN